MSKLTVGGKEVHCVSGAVLSNPIFDRRGLSFEAQVEWDVSPNFQIYPAEVTLVKNNTGGYSVTIDPKLGYTFIEHSRLAELQSTVEDLDWLLNYLNTYVQEEALADFWKVASEFCEGADECPDPMLCGQQAIRQMRGAK